jgi:hypothetical protein
LTFLYHPARLFASLQQLRLRSPAGSQCLDSLNTGGMVYG